jgi:hypothetical protein
MIRSLKIHDCLWSYLCRFSPSSHFLPRNIHNNSCSPCRTWFISSLYNLNSASFSNQTKQHFYDFVATQRSLDVFSWCSNEEISCLKWFWYSCKATKQSQKQKRKQETGLLVSLKHNCFVIWHHLPPIRLRVPTFIHVHPQNTLDIVLGHTCN